MLTLVWRLRGAVNRHIKIAEVIIMGHSIDAWNTITQAQRVSY